MDVGLETDAVIKLNHSAMDAIKVMAGGNPGAITVCCEILKWDPMRGLEVLLRMDTAKIRSHRIWVAYKDFCKEKLEVLINIILSRDRNFLSLLTADRSWDQ